MDTGTTAFMLCCIIGLTMMIPGLALFYGGMVSVKSSTNMMMMTFGAVAVVGVLWVLFGFSMTFGTSYGGFVGSFFGTACGFMRDLFSGIARIFRGIFYSRFRAFSTRGLYFRRWCGFSVFFVILKSKLNFTSAGNNFLHSSFQ